MLPGSRQGPARQAPSGDSSLPPSSSGNIARFLSETVSRAARQSPSTSPTASKTRPSPDQQQPIADDGIWPLHRSRITEGSDLSRSNSLARSPGHSAILPAQAGSSRLSGSTSTSSNSALTPATSSNSFVDYTSTSFNTTGSPLSAASTTGSNNRSSASDRARRRKSSFQSPTSGVPSVLTDSDRYAILGKAATPVKPAKRKPLSKGGGEGWEWFKRDNVYSQRYHPSDSSNTPYMLPYLREQADLYVGKAGRRRSD